MHMVDLTNPYVMIITPSTICKKNQSFFHLNQGMTLRPCHDAIKYDKSGKLPKAIHDVYLLDACSGGRP